MSGRTVLVTGGAGYIGSHCTVELLEAGYNVVALDNFINSVPRARARHAALPGTRPADYRQTHYLLRHTIDCVIHFAAIKAVGESMQFPLLYYKNNLIATINLLEVMEEHNVWYFPLHVRFMETPESLPITETHPTGDVTNVYGRTKHFIEGMLKDISVANKKWNFIALRYFNPVGAHPSGLIGEDPTKAFTNIMPYMAQVAIGNKPHLTIFGGDYDTEDGTGVRDYIHVMDLAKGHVAALDKLQKEHQRLKFYNLGTGNGVSVLQLLKTFESVTKSKIPFKICDRREGDIVSMYANASLAENELGWKAKFTLPQMCADFWRWQTLNPDGYRKCAEANGSRKKSTNGHGLPMTENLQ
ncbi:LOW QUALITY PROTEIN: UDP-glucose 4-epimerase [Frankliniella fusca]|uniref:UDP-glucose 4-epimerase n=1 Tax=Frankliniella fusca TaxID=407009 RepID=A0AAE1L9F3_9NEOP|nr:LOW QUALITY PROTEIN: UDP-glucose 4-epimerase [Frankliniella fusca]